LIHLAFLLLIVVFSHHLVVFMGLFLLFLRVLPITDPRQGSLPLRSALWVGVFLGGLAIFGRCQGWWLNPLFTSLSRTPLFLGATVLTAFVDNAALTTLGAQVRGLADPLRIALVAGAVAGGGLTVIANAPNPIGYSILKDRIGSLHAHRLVVAAIVPTLIASICFMIF
jgi:hypothetical protein